MLTLAQIFDCAPSQYLISPPATGSSCMLYLNQGRNSFQLSQTFVYMLSVLKLKVSAWQQQTRVGNMRGMLLQTTMSRVRFIYPSNGQYSC